MVKCLFNIIFIFFVTQLLAVDVSITHCSFKINGENYVEFYSRISSESLKYIQLQNGDKQASVAAMFLIKKGNDIIEVDKFILASPVNDTITDFWSVRKYKLDAGEYKLECTFSDVNDESSNLNQQRTFYINSDFTEASASDILLFAAASRKDSKLPFAKNGINYEPLAYDLISPELEILIFNIEFYDLDKSKKEFYIGMNIYEGFTGVFGNSVLKKHKKLEKRAYLPLVENLPIRELPSGEYHLTIELYDYDKNKILYREKNFTVIQPIGDIRLSRTFDKEFENSFVQIMTHEELNYSLKAITSQVGENLGETLNTVLAENDLKTKKYFLYAFWSQVSVDNPGKAHDSYMEVARAIDQKFRNNVGFGFETDRGYVFMKYGRPNDLIEVPDEPSAPPYEIWIYNDFPHTNQTNVKFLFYNPSLSGENFQLLHSTATNELSNPQWEQVLYSNVPDQQIGNSIDGRTVQDNFNRNARRYFQDN